MNKIIQRVRSLHSYSVPEIIALPIIAGSPDYLEWVGEMTKE
jgi:periplasmic divalent cation tolerance protein